MDEHEHEDKHPAEVDEPIEPGEELGPAPGPEGDLEPGEDLFIPAHPTTDDDEEGGGEYAGTGGEQ